MRVTFDKVKEDMMDKSEKNRRLQRNRIYRYFIDAAVDIINESGIDAITIRAVSERAGYNSATLYNYFANLEHLKFFAAISVLDKYVQNLSTVTNEDDGCREKYIKIWLAFAENSFEYPEHYYIIFFSEMQSNMEEYLQDYLDLIVDDEHPQDEVIQNMLKETSLTNRSMVLMNECIESGIVSKKEGETIDEIVILVYQSLLLQVKQGIINPRNALNSFSTYLNQLI